MMQENHRIKIAVIISILLHILLFGIATDRYNRESASKAIKSIPIDYYKLEKPAEVLVHEEVFEKKKIIIKEKPIPIPPKKLLTEEPEKVEKFEKPLDKMTEKIENQPVIQEIDKVKEPAPLVEPEIAKVEEPVAPAQEPVEAEPAKEITAEPPKIESDEIIVEKKEKEIDNYDDLLLKNSLKSGAGDKKEKEPVKLARILPSIERLEELKRLEDENTRGVGESEVDEIYLDSTSVKYASYLDHIKNSIELAWNYPESAAKRGLQGEGVLSFTIGSEGKLAEIKLLNSTGSDILDDRFVRAVKMAAPFPPLPKNFRTKNLKVTATYRYILSIIYK